MRGHGRVTTTIVRASHTAHLVEYIVELVEVGTTACKSLLMTNQMQTFTQGVDDSSKRVAACFVACTSITYVRSFLTIENL